MFLQHCKQVSLFVPTQKNLKAFTHLQKEPPNTPGISGEVPQADIQFSVHPDCGWLLLVFLLVQFRYQVFYRKKLPVALNAYSSVKIQARRRGVTEHPAQLIPQSVPVHCPASYHSIKAQRYSTSGFNKTWLPRKWWEKRGACKAALAISTSLYENFETCFSDKYSCP